jgi:TolB protein
MVRGVKRALLVCLVLAIVAPACRADVPRPELLVVVDGDGAVAVIHADGSLVTEVPATEAQRHFQPIWIDGDTLIFATTESQRNRLTTVDRDGIELWSVEYPTPVFFTLPSPNGSQVATLRASGDNSPIVAELWSEPEGVERVGNEAPFYVAWSPDSESLAAHIGAARLETLTPEPSVIEEVTGLFQAPYSSPDGVVGIRVVGDDQRVSVWNGDGHRDVALVRGPVRFVGTGDKIAIATEPGETLGERAVAQSLPRIPQGAVSVLDLSDGSITPVTRLPTALFQWDRLGQKLLFASITAGTKPQLQWHVWQDGETKDYAAFSPDPSWVAEFVPFFDQYAPTTLLWSSSGDAFAYPAVIDGQARIMVQTLGTDEPTEASTGSWVSWNP